MTKHYFDPRLKIFALNSNRPLAEKIAEAVGVELGKSSVKKFSDGEIQINIEESIRGSHVYIVQSTSNPVNDNLMELLIKYLGSGKIEKHSKNPVVNLTIGKFSDINNIIIPFYRLWRRKISIKWNKTIRIYWLVKDCKIN